MNQSYRIWDITPMVSPSIPVWPGDTPFQSEAVWVMSAQCPVTVSRMTLSPHTGAHVDAPMHYQPNGIPIGEVDLSYYIGECYVVHAFNQAPVLNWSSLMQSLPSRLPPRLLIRTYQQSPSQWDSGFCAIDAEVIKACHQRGVRLIGVDTPSLDPETSKTMLAHRAIAESNMAILEGIVLDEVPEGYYELIALPLKLQTVDASPVRAILRQPAI